MSSSDVVISVEHLSKRYLIGGPEKHATLRDQIDDFIRHPFGFGKSYANQQEFWALKDVSFDIKKGDVVGVIGRNGSGKSTLLKILSRIVEPTEGKAVLHGRVASLLEVGTGFNAELTGRENIYLNGAILGMSKKEIDAKFNEIVEFSGVEKFIDTPVKRYSSGMYVRLAFTVAAHLDSDILLVDEVLAVGDAEFQKKCLGKMRDLAGSGRTVLYVSHNMPSLQILCNKAIYIKNGEIVSYGPIRKVANQYLSQESFNTLTNTFDDTTSNEWVALKHASVEMPHADQVIDVNTQLEIKYVFEIKSQTAMNLSLVLWSADNLPIFNCVTESKNLPDGTYEGILEIPGHFLNDGSYSTHIMFVSEGKKTLSVENSLRFEVADIKREGSWFGKWVGAVRPNLPFTISDIK